MKLGLCLAGGGVKGAAHIGVIKAFEEEKINFNYISGTSSGSIVAILYAIGYSSDEIHMIFKEYANKITYIELKNIFKLIYGIVVKKKLIISGLNEGKKIEEIIKKTCNSKNIFNIKQVQKNILIPSVDLHSGTIYCFTSKKIRNTFSDNIVYIDDIEIEKAVRASCSYPVIFSPFKYNKVELIDGGIRENIPWKYTKHIGADKVISVVFKEELEEKCCDNIIEVADRSLQILSHELSNYELDGADYILEIKSKKIPLLEAKEIDTLVETGYKTAKKSITSIKEKFL